MEFFLYVLNTYHENLDKNKYSVFADIHFALFYTAIFNAFQSVLLAFCTVRVSRKIWVKTEMLELNHYVEIREEFEHVKHQLDMLHERTHGTHKGSKSSVASSTSSEPAPPTSSSPFPQPNEQDGRRGSTSSTGSPASTIGDPLRNFGQAILDRIQYPAVRRKYTQLLLQVRFHELRVHFLQAYELPLKLKISDYLMRSEQNVLLKLVHVSSIAWLLLTGAVNLLYYVLGIVSYKVSDSSVVGVALIWIFFWCMGVFVVVTFLVYKKMGHIFKCIMVEKTLWDVNNVEKEERGRLAEQQLALFWGGDPKLVIAAIQFMQFGYAVALSVIIIYWNEIDTGGVGMEVYLVVLCLCYAVFVLVAAQVIPRYTLCTSLGQLVNEKRLQETLATHLLEEAKRKQAQLVYIENIDSNLFAPDDDDEEDKDGNKKDEPSASVKPKLLQPVRDFGQGAVKVIKNVASNISSSTPERGEVQDDAPPLMADLVKLDTDSLRTHLQEEERNQLGTRQMMIRGGRRGRRKAHSEGVAAMAAMGTTTSTLSPWSRDAFSTKPHVHGDTGLADSFNLPKLDETEVTRREDRHASRRKTHSDDVALMSRLHGSHGSLVDISDRSEKARLAAQSLGVGAYRKNPPSPVSTSREIGDDQARLMAELVKLDTDSLRDNLPEFERNRLISRQMHRADRRDRRKTRSEGVAAMAAMEGVTFMKAAKNPFRAMDDTFLASSHQHEGIHSTDTGPAMPSLASESTGVSVPQQNRPRRGRRKKSVSDGVALMSRLDGADLAFYSVPQPVPEEHSHHFDDEISHSSFRSVNELSPPQLPTLQPVADIQEALTSETQPVRNKVMFADLDDDGSTRSDDGHSDVDDVPEVDNSIIFQQSIEQPKGPTIGQRLAKYFQSGRYIVVSNVFGTMVAFFLIGQRIERFLHTQGIVPPKFVSFDFEERYTFWGLMFLFMSFLIGDAIILFLFKPWNGLYSSVQRKTVFGAMLDSVLVGTCLIVYIVAESKRCCHPEDETERMMEETYGDGNGIDYWYMNPAPCSCPSFGKRLYGGLGRIEPYTSLVALRVFRHWVAKRIVIQVERRKLLRTSFGNENRSLSTRGLNFDPFSVFNEGDNHAGAAEHGHGGHGHKHDGHGHGGNGHGDDERGTAAELWRAAVSEHPEIVARYGEFSGELLKAMLGLHVDSHTPHGSSRQGALSDIGDIDEPPDVLKTKKFVLGEEYAELPAETQEIIMAGKLGRKVKSSLDLAALDQNSDEKGVTPGPGVRFQVDLDAVEEKIHGDIEFTCPSGRLVRSMRRCDRMLLPIINSWAVVDVVLTRFEIVYFDAATVDKESVGDGAGAIKQALSATKGGKGLRLCDVAEGRKVVGHIELSEIESVTVEREMPALGDAEQTHNRPEVEVDLVEYWKQSHHGYHGPHDSRSKAWASIKQDRIKIQTIHGHTLYLRFYSDLEDAEMHPDRLAEEDEYEGPIFKNNAFQWAQTIGRFCGPDILKQSLPHFGDDTDDELRDYLVVHHHHVETERGHRRMVSLPSIMHLNEAGRPKPIRRLSSIGSNSTKKPVKFHRSHSSGPDDMEPKKPRSYHRSASDGLVEDNASIHVEESFTSPVEPKSSVEPSHNAEEAGILPKQADGVAFTKSSAAVSSVTDTLTIPAGDANDVHPSTHPTETLQTVNEDSSALVEVPSGDDNATRFSTAFETDDEEVPSVFSSAFC